MLHFEPLPLDSIKVLHSMNKIFLLIAFILISTASFADKKPPIEKAKDKTEKMQKDLQLSADQTKKIYEVNLKSYTLIADYDAKKPDKKLKKKQKAIVQDLRDDQYKKILTSVQYKKYKAIRKQEKEEEKKLEATQSAGMK